MTHIAMLLALSLAPVQAPAQAFQPSANPVTDHVRKILPTSAKNLIASAELMPADKYEFHPTPAQMTFGQLIQHIVQTNVAICAGIGGGTLPEYVRIAATAPKEALVDAIKQSFAYCTETMTKTMDPQLAGEIMMMGRATGMSRAAAVITITNDWADHYSTAAAYLRLNSILPPSTQAPPAPGR